MFFQDRFHAGELLLDQLLKYKNNSDVVVLAIPRGALEIGYVLAKNLHVPLDVVLTKKIGAPNNPEFAIAALNREGDIVFADEMFKHIEWKNYIDSQVKILKESLDKKFLQYHPDGHYLDIKNKIVIVVDDGVATGNTLISALQLIKKRSPKKVVVALPVGPPDIIKKIEEFADEVVCLYKPEVFNAIGQFYRNFDQVEDVQALQLFSEANK